MNSRNPRSLSGPSRSLTEPRVTTAKPYARYLPGDTWFLCRPVPGRHRAPTGLRRGGRNGCPGGSERAADGLSRSAGALLVKRAAWSGAGDEGSLADHGDDQAALAQLAHGPPDGLVGHAPVVGQVALGRELLAALQCTRADLPGHVISNLGIQRGRGVRVEGRRA